MLVHQLNRLRQTQIPTTTGVYPITITYPSSGNYPDNDLQEWYFFPETDGNKLVFTMDSINTESPTDTVQVSEYAIPLYVLAQPILQSYVGTSIGTPVETSVGFRVRFVSDASINSTGFTFTISEVSGGTSALTSLDYPSGVGNYPSNDQKIWRISNGTTSFSAFTTESGFDFLRVYEITDLTSAPTLLQTLSGTILPSDIISSNELIMYFSSDGGVENTGFILNVT